MLPMPMLLTHMPVSMELVSMELDITVMLLEQPTTLARDLPKLKPNPKPGTEPITVMDTEPDTLDMPHTPMEPDTVDIVMLLHTSTEDTHTESKMVNKF